MSMSTDMWTYREDTVAPGDAPRNVVGYDVEATDGSIGKVDDATYDVGSSHLVVDTGPWIFGKKVMLPAGVIQSVDHDAEKIMVDRSKDEIKNAPELDEDSLTDEDLSHAPRLVLRRVEPLTERGGRPQRPAPRQVNLARAEGRAPRSSPASGAGRRPRPAPVSRGPRRRAGRRTVRRARRRPGSRTVARRGRRPTTAP